MSIAESIQLPTNTVMTSPIGTALKLVLFQGKEGIGNLGVTGYEGVITFKELADHFQIEANSDQLNEELKKQRDVDQTRVKGLKSYWESTEGAVFPNMTIFASELSDIEALTVGNRQMVLAALDPLADRFLCDGQGRTTFIKWLLEQADAEQFADHTVSIKLIVTHTENLSTPKAIKIIKQVFADYHCRLMKPNKSISKHFDTGTPFARFLNELLEIDAGGLIKRRVALHGKFKRGHLWTYDQFTSVVQKFLNVTPATAKKLLQSDDNYRASYALCEGFLKRLFAILPVEELDSDEYAVIHENSMFTKAIFANACGYVGRSIVDEMLIDESVTWEKLAKPSLPILSKEDKYWQKSRVTMDDNGAIKIIKGTDRRIGALLCREMRILPCEALSA
ncbi:DGQHR domain-containing protein [Shewanella marisflavi]|uniref:DGQHR domain-containing protein n=1 Tax=Shewanella marisflavi TaxID=260364 RepID=UPI003AAB3CB0